MLLLFCIRNGRTYDPMIDRSRVRSLHTEILVRSFRTLKINTTSCRVNHVYTLPPKLSSVIKKLGPGSIFCVFASVASILIEYGKKEKRITLAPVEENGQCSSDHIQWRIIRNYIMYKGHARTNLFSDTKENKNAPLLSQNTLLQCFFTLVLETAPPRSTFCATAAAQIWLDGPVCHGATGLVFSYREWCE